MSERWQPGKHYVSGFIGPCWASTRSQSYPEQLSCSAMVGEPLFRNRPIFGLPAFSSALNSLPLSSAIDMCQVPSGAVSEGKPRGPCSRHAGTVLQKCCEHVSSMLRLASCNRGIICGHEQGLLLTSLRRQDRGRARGDIFYLHQFPLHMRSGPCGSRWSYILVVVQY